MLSMATMAMDITLVMPTTVMPTMERDLLMLSQVLMLMPTTDTMVMEPTFVMPTAVTTMARDPLMLSQRLMLMPSMDTMDMDITSVMPTMERDLLMLKPMLMLTTDTHTLTVTDMPTADTTDTHTLTDGESKMLTKS